MRGRPLACLVALLLLPLASATPEPPSLPMWFSWDRASLDVLVVPPHHGPAGACAVTCDGSNALAALELTHYWSAVGTFIDDWLRTRDLHVAAHPEHAWLGAVEVRTTMAYRDAVLPEHVRDADIIVGHYETGGPLLGVAVHPTHSSSAEPVEAAAGEKCFALASLGYGTSNLTWADYYNLGAHEFGHCLGLGHANVEHDTMDGSYAHRPGETDALHCPSNLDGAALALSFGEVLGHAPTDTYATVPVWARHALRAGCEVP